MRGVSGKLKGDSEFKCQTCSNQQAGIPDWLGVKKWKSFCYLADTTGIRRGAVESVIKRIRSDLLYWSDSFLVVVSEVVGTEVIVT